VEKNDSWFSYQGTRMAQGRDAARTYLVEHQEVLRELRNLLLEKAGVAGSHKLAPVPTAEPNPDEKAPARPPKGKANPTPAAAAA
jgi:recombination protein RecA